MNEFSYVAGLMKGLEQFPNEFEEALTRVFNDSIQSHDGEVWSPKEDIVRVIELISAVLFVGKLEEDVDYGKDARIVNIMKDETIGEAGWLRPEYLENEGTHIQFHM